MYSIRLLHKYRKFVFLACAVVSALKVEDMKVNLNNYTTFTTSHVVNFTSRHTLYPLLDVNNPMIDLPDLVRAERVEAGGKTLPRGIEANRTWFHWTVIVPSRQPLPVEIASRINEVAGSEIRAFGYPKGAFPQKFQKLTKKAQGVSFWHIDTKEGLALLLKVLKDFYEPDSQKSLYYRIFKPQKEIYVLGRMRKYIKQFKK